MGLGSGWERREFSEGSSWWQRCWGDREADLELGLDAPGSTVPMESGLGLEQCRVFLGDGVSVPTIFP